MSDIFKYLAPLDWFLSLLFLSPKHFHHCFGYPFSTSKFPIWIKKKRKHIFVIDQKFESQRILERKYKDYKSINNMSHTFRTLCCVVICMNQMKWPRFFVCSKINAFITLKRKQTRLILNMTWHDRTWTLCGKRRQLITANCDVVQHSYE